MPKQCKICSKTSSMSTVRTKLRGKYNPTDKKRKYPNLQSLTVPLSVTKKGFKKFAGEKVIACAKCIKTLGKVDK